MFLTRFLAGLRLVSTSTCATAAILLHMHTLTLQQRLYRTLRNPLVRRSLLCLLRSRACKPHFRFRHQRDACISMNESGSKS